MRDIKKKLRLTMEKGIKKSTEIIETGKEIAENEKEKKREKLENMFQGWEGENLRRINYQLETVSVISFKEIGDTTLKVVFKGGELDGLEGIIHKGRIEVKGPGLVEFALKHVDFGSGFKEYKSRENLSD